MPTLPVAVRSTLERAVLAARAAAESGANAALIALAVASPEPLAALSADQRRLRNALRARARQLGAGVVADGCDPLADEIAYHHWHRLLFARCLAENGLLMHPTGVAITLADCAELARGEGLASLADAWAAAARYAADMLPGIFRPADPVSRLRFAPEHRRRLESIVEGLPAVVFTSDDGLGWMYQFWQTQKKREINASERKIGGADLAPVTQLFTEDYMVRFLLENSLGAWWAARHPDSPLVSEFEYLRKPHPPTPSPQGGEGEIPAAGAFPGWPARAAEITIMDPCCGSGHFLVVACDMLRRMRMEEEGLSAAAAGDAVLRDNLFGLELDPRCTQIAAFALALAAWKSGGYRVLPPLNIACSGLPVRGQLEAWTRLARGDERLHQSLERLYHLFQDAPHLGSLINPADLPDGERLFSAAYDQVQPLLERALAQGGNGDDPAALFSAAAGDAARAARLLASKYTLVATNVPYLARGRQCEVLQRFIELHFSHAKMDIATAFVERCRTLSSTGGVYALVTPQNWLSQASYRQLRQKILRYQQFDVAVRLGPGAFRTISGEVVKPALLILSNRAPHSCHEVCGIEIAPGAGADLKAIALRQVKVTVVRQKYLLDAPSSRVHFEPGLHRALLSSCATSVEGLSTGDSSHYIRMFWELPNTPQEWAFMQGGPPRSQHFGGCEQLLWWEQGKGEISRSPAARIQGHAAWGRPGILVCRMSAIRCSMYLGGLYDKSCVIVVPQNPDHLLPIWQYCASEQYGRSIRAIEPNLSVATATLVQVPFDLAHWQQVAEAAGPLPEPHSDAPTQWLFHGRPEQSTAPLQVAVARLLGYRWPAELDDNMRLSERARDLVRRCDALLPFVVEDGIACLPAAAGHPPAVQRLRALLAAAYGPDWSPAREQALLAEAGGGPDLDAWLRDAFFSQHCRLFHNRPFIWQVWDGRRDGFSALVNYHRLDAAGLQKLTYTYLGDWIGRQREDAARGEPGAEGRLVAAQALQHKLQAIHTGEPPYDIYVRWKPLHRQPIGWQPDLNDGVRLNIRPFVQAGVLRSRFTIHWNKDRGTNPDGSQRLNDLHYTIADKQAARAAQSLPPDP